MGNAARFARFPAENVLGLACTGHGASLAYVDRAGAVRASVFERWAGTKDALLFSRDEDRDICLSLDRSEVDEQLHAALAQAYRTFPRVCVFEDTFADWIEWFLAGSGVSPGDIEMCVASDSYFVTSRWRLGTRLGTWLPKARIILRPEHHEVHQRQAFWQSGFEAAAVLTLDSSGEPLRRLGGRRLAGTIARMHADGTCRTLREFLCPEMSAGGLYATFNHHVGFRQNQEGKTMGLAPFGRDTLLRRLEPLLGLHDDGGFEFPTGADLRRLLSSYVPPRPPSREAPILREHEDVAFAGQALIERIVANAFRAACELAGSSNLAFAGGVALNCVANEVAFEAALPARLYVAPNAGDTGHALGCALLGAHEIAGWPPTGRELPEYLGPAYSPAEIAAAAAQAGSHCERPDDLARVVARCIANGHVVARFDGRAEYGPRALGNRSLLADPRRKDMKDHLNRRIKHREPFRPFAPAVLATHADRWFAMTGSSPYMLRAVRVDRRVAAAIPAVVHVDGTARVQTVRADDNPGFAAILAAFAELTGIPLLLNTSLNVDGRPMVETPMQAVECFLSTDIGACILGPFVLSKRPLHALLEAPNEELATLAV